MKNFMSRKGDLTLNTIVIAALVLIVLVVLIMIFTGNMNKVLIKMGIITEETCSGLGGRFCENPCPDYELTEADDVPAGKICCQFGYLGEC